MKLSDYEVVQEQLKKAPGAHLIIKSPGTDLQIHMCSMTQKDFEPKLMSPFREGYDRWAIWATKADGRLGGGVFDVLASHGDIVNVMFAGKPKFLKSVFGFLMLTNDPRHPTGRRHYREWKRDRRLRASMFMKIVQHVFSLFGEEMRDGKKPENIQE